MAVTPKRRPSNAAPLERPLVKDKLESAMTFKNEAPCCAAGTLGDRGPVRGTARARKPDTGAAMPSSSRGRLMGEGDVPLTPRFYHHFDEDMSIPMSQSLSLLEPACASDCRKRESKSSNNDVLTLFFASTRVYTVEVSLTIS